MKAMILAAGYGTRLSPLTEDTPKPMLPLLGKPLLEYTLSYLNNQGVTEILLNTHFQPEKISAYFKDGSAYNTHISYSHEPSLLGTAGAIKQAESFFEGQDALVIYGDILTNQSLAPLLNKHKQEEADATIFVHKRKYSNSIIDINESGQITSFKERPPKSEWEGRDGAWVNSGMQILKLSMLASIEKGQVADLPKNIYVPQVQTKRIFTVPLTEFRIAIDSVERYRSAEDAIKKGLL